MTQRLQVQCLVQSKSSIPVRRVVRLCHLLVKEFRNHPVLKTSQKKARGHHGNLYELTVVFLSQGKARALNKKFRGKDYATDVLSFSPQAPHEGLGDLVLCVDILKKQAREEGHSLKKELDYMIIHGFLHLLGFDHEKNRREELKMMRLQDKLFSKLSPGKA